MSGSVIDSVDVGAVVLADDDAGFAGEVITSAVADTGSGAAGTVFGAGSGFILKPSGW